MSDRFGKSVSFTRFGSTVIFGLIRWQFGQPCGTITGTGSRKAGKV